MLTNKMEIGKRYYGSGSPGNPSVGNLSDNRLTLTLNPASPLFVTLPQVSALALPNQGANGTGAG